MTGIDTAHVQCEKDLESVKSTKHNYQTDTKNVLKTSSKHIKPTRCPSTNIWTKEIVQHMVVVPPGTNMCLPKMPRHEQLPTPAAGTPT